MVSSFGGGFVAGCGRWLLELGGIFARILASFLSHKFILVVER